jgi:hypothetical protein
MGRVSQYRKQLWFLAAVCCLAAAAAAVSAQQSDSIRVQVELVRASGSDRGINQHPDASSVAVWLIPLDFAPPSRPTQPAPRLVQKNKVFTPHVLVVQQGASVEFPNEDPFFHNVFSLFAGKRFDLGLYESGSSRAVRFERPGASFLFCNIHPEMTAVVVVVPTPFYGTSDSAGRVNIPAVPDGRYELKVWHERSSPEELKDLERVVTISSTTRSIGPIRISDTGTLTLTHKNKYGQDYAPALANTAY